MPVPSNENIRRPLLESLADGNEHRLTDSVADTARRLRLSAEDLAEMIPSGRHRLFYDHLCWTRWYLVKAGLLLIPRRGLTMITELGLKALTDAPDIITDEWMNRYPEYTAYKKAVQAGTTAPVEGEVVAEVDDLASMSIGQYVVDQKATLRGNRLSTYFPLLLDALKSTDPEPMNAARAAAWIRSHIDVPRTDITRRVGNGAESVFENDIRWASYYLVKAGLIEVATRGSWALTSSGRATNLSSQDSLALYNESRRSSHLGPAEDDDSVPAPGSDADDVDGGRSFWFVGSVWGEADQTSRFITDGIWQNFEYNDDSALVNQMRPGDRVAMKATFVRRLGLPFDVGGKPVSTMRIKAVGTVIENVLDGITVKVAWDPPFTPREWYFYTYRSTIILAARDNYGGSRLIDFTFRGASQDYAWWLAQPYWVKKYGAAAPGPVSSGTPVLEASEDEPEVPIYTVDNIISDGCFVEREEIEKMLVRWRSKKNMVLQGPPGTGKTWLAKRLGFAMIGSDDREASRSRLRVVQFHPSLAYEDFVRGWRPNGDGRLALIDGILMQAISAAASEPDKPFVLVVEEINRGNPSQIFGEMLTLLEDTKRRPSEAMELAYSKEAGELVYVPSNLYLIGTMNVADRSLAIVDLALRRRFAFVDLEPTFGAAWRVWCTTHGLEDTLAEKIGVRVADLNAEISAAPSLGPQFRIGQSYFTPDRGETINDGLAWYRAKVEMELGPLLDEYWYDSLETASTAKAKLLAHIAE